MGFWGFGVLGFWGFGVEFRRIEDLELRIQVTFGHGRSSAILGRIARGRPNRNLADRHHDRRSSPGPSRPRWRAIAGRTIVASTTDHVSLAAAGCAFYATLSLFPAISMLISVYGLAFDPSSVVPQLAVLREVLPTPAFMLIEDRVLQIVAQPREHLSLGLAIAFLVSTISSASASKAVLSALNVAYDTTERRPFFLFQLIGLAMTLGTVVCAVLAIAVLLVLPRLIQFSGLSQFGAALIQIVSFALLVTFFAVGLAVLCTRGARRGRSPPNARILPGTALATLVWLLSPTCCRCTSANWRISTRPMDRWAPWWASCCGFTSPLTRRFWARN